YRGSNLALREAEVVDEQLPPIRRADMVEALQVCFPVAHVLVIDPVDDMLAHNQIGLIGVVLVGKEVRRDQVRLMYRGAFIAAADSGQHLLSQPYEICLQVGKQGW